MSFHLNNAQQIAINDSLLSLTKREIKHLDFISPPFSIYINVIIKQIKHELRELFVNIFSVKNNILTNYSYAL